MTPKERVQRNYTPADIHPETALEAAVTQHELESKHKNYLTLFFPLENKTIEDHTFNTFIEKWIRKLNSHRNVKGFSIGFICRPNLLKPDAPDDPIANYNTHDYEALETNKAATWNEQVNIDNHAVYDRGETSFMGTHLWIHSSKKTQKIRDGRKLVQENIAAVIGPDAQDTRSRRNKKTFEKLTYHGEKQHNNWRKYIEKRIECYAVQEGLAAEDPVRYYVAILAA